MPPMRGRNGCRRKEIIKNETPSENKRDEYKSIKKGACRRGPNFTYRAWEAGRPPHTSCQGFSELEPSAVGPFFFTLNSAYQAPLRGSLKAKISREWLTGCGGCGGGGGGGGSGSSSSRRSRGGKSGGG
ncbi:uncharacterized protein RHO17_007713 [Thomomys bottae]